MNQREKGFSLMELIVYVALLGMLSVFATNALIQIASTYQRSRAEHAALSDARTLLDTLVRAISQAKEVYAPTSRFGSDAGQLSLVTAVGARPGHTDAYVDFWSDNGVFLTRAEGSATTTLSSVGVRVTKLRFERMVQSYGREAVRTTLRVEAINQHFPASVVLTVTTALRGSY
ncbi:MAG: prepilin-type N-terminal cleavage/methylation domain-containing protein [Candidatus Sungbacteria bacterium]|uniref:Prepilin-type N-terminal cleavage/methylation domain-containing protein n=1 Tax=Candidatus Sungiibacteriota bacterium TaxID=2750080 RepID=A0A932QY46_9BACT|nr:prepilin-type N-terminal cleavage/methylation domain-containing protein [Candidatus Sungbacteria bacterium]